MPTTFHAWYSPTAAYYYGSVIYVREDGSEVEITCADYDLNYDYRWSDKIYVGKVVKYLRNGREKNIDTTLRKEKEY